MKAINNSDLIACISIQEAGNWDRIYERVRHREIPEPETVIETLKGLKYRYLTIFDKEYPKEMLKMTRPPFVLFYYGDISLILDKNKKRVAVIGSREYSEYGENATRNLVSEISDKVIVVSGMAKGIDCIAQETTISLGGKTVGILGSGIDYCYPIENFPLYNKLKEDHLLISEYPGKTPPTFGSFPFRNRLIAYFSDAVLVTEAGERSGTSITVGWALSLGKDIMCIPYPYGAPSACNRLIKEGAALVENGGDVLETIS